MMRRLDIQIDELVVHGEQSFDVAAFERHLAQALTERLGNRAAGPSAATTDATAREVALRIAASLPPGSFRRETA
jgi:hypothetical protein